MKTQLVELTKETALTAFTGDTGLDGYVEEVRAEIAAFDHDLSTGVSRAKTISLASKVGKIKVKYDNCGKDLVADWKANALKVDKARKKMRDELDELKILARKPVTDWEEEQLKIEAENKLKLEVEMLAKQKANDEEVAVLMDEKFDRELAEAVAKQLAEAKIEEDRLKQVKIDSDILIAKEATIEAERLAKKAIDDALTAKQEAIDEKIKADKELLESQARQELLEKQAAQTKLNNEWLAYISEAYEENASIDRQRQTKLLTAQAETKRLEDIEQAKQVQIQAQKDQLKAEQAAQAKLEANKKHAGLILGEIKKHIMETCGIDEPISRKIVLALRNTDRVTINY